MIFFPFIRFFENLNIFSNSKLKKVWFQACDLSFCFLLNSLVFFIQKSAIRGRDLPDAIVSLKNLRFSRAERTTRGREAPDAEKSCRVLTAQREGAKRPMRCLKIGDGVSKHLQCPFGLQGRIYTTRPEGRSYLRVGWDRMGEDGMDGRGVKSVLQFGSHFVGIYRTCIPSLSNTPPPLPTLKFTKQGGVDCLLRCEIQYILFPL